MCVTVFLVGAALLQSMMNISEAILANLVSYTISYLLHSYLKYKVCKCFIVIGLFSFHLRSEIPASNNVDHPKKVQH